MRTDLINILYADNILQDAAGNYLYSYPIIQAAPSAPVCAGAIDPAGAFVTLAANCFTMPGATNPITTGNLIMFHNQNGTALEYVTSVAGPRINFAAGDPGAEPNWRRAWNGSGTGHHAGKFSANDGYAGVVGYLLR